MGALDTPPAVMLFSRQEQAVLDALADERYDFRTVGSIASDTGIGPAQVEEILTSLDEVRLSPVPGPHGEALYTLKSPSPREQLAFAQTVISKSVS